MNQTISAMPGDSVPQSLMAYPGIGDRLTFDFSAVIPSGDTISTYSIGVSDSSKMYFISASSTATTVVANFGSTMSSGQVVLISCSILTAGSLQDGRSVRLIGYDSTANSSAPPGDDVLISAPVTMVPGTINDMTTIALPQSITVIGAVVGNAAIVSANPALPTHVSIVNAQVSASGVVTAEIENLTGGPVTIGTTAFTATVIQ